MALDSAIIEKLAMVGLTIVPSDLDAPQLCSYPGSLQAFLRPQMIMSKKRST